MEEIDYLCVWAYKRRSGWAGGRLLGSMIAKRRNKLWEMRSIVVVGHTLSYYETGTEDSDEPRGKIDLWADQASFQIEVGGEADGAPTKHQISIRAQVKQQPQDAEDGSAAASADISGTGSTVATTRVEWKLCFDSQEDLMRLVSVLNSILDEGGAFAQKDLGRFEHQFAKGDHIYRWEMIVCPPVIYPIQIHAIVLEAGRNILVVADFGLTGYAKKKDSQFHHTEDNEDAMQEKIMASFRKLRPKDQTQRLNILTLTDPMEIRKWIKAGYDEESMLAKAKAAKHHIPLDKLFSKKSSPSSKASPTSGTRKLSSSSLPSAWMKRTSFNRRDSAEEGSSEMFPKFYRTDDEVENESRRESSEGDSSSDMFPKLYRTDDEIQNEQRRESVDAESSSAKLYRTDDDFEHQEAEDTTSEQDKATQKDLKSKPISFDEDLDIKPSSSNKSLEEKTKEKPEELPHSDPVEIVIARANFVLENMDVLPPYHVFFSNSECIAVWCKTGRWSTLQTAVWCSTNSVGALKTSTLTTLGVAATNPLLAPVIAIGGLLWVTAPMIILQKSKVAWEEYTKKMTELFWAWAPPIVYVSAIENWTIILQKRAAAAQASIQSSVEKQENGQEDEVAASVATTVSEDDSEPTITDNPKEETHGDIGANVDEKKEADENGPVSSNADPVLAESSDDDAKQEKFDGETMGVTSDGTKETGENGDGASNADPVFVEANNDDTKQEVTTDNSADETIEERIVQPKEVEENGGCLSSADPILSNDIKQEASTDNNIIEESLAELKEPEENAVFLSNADPILSD